MLLKPLDVGILIPAFGAALVSFFFAYSGPGGQYTIRVKGADGEWIFPQNAVQTISVAGPLGDTIVEIREGRARVLSSPCANQTCVAAGNIHTPGQWAACLPNRVILVIGAGANEAAPAQNSGGSEGGVDAAAW